ncbi:MAG TPA: hypothetical protein DEP45_00265 [Armatimonadetes bacterium]|nr:hypothetical protein [Armatimonadota bacterium]
MHWWGIGNETYGGREIGGVPAEAYARLLLRFAERMRAEDPSIELVAVGADPFGHADWNRTVLGIAGHQVDHLSVQRYVPHRRDDSERERQYNAIVASPVDVEQRLRMVTDTLEGFRRPNGRPGVAFDEWNVSLDAAVVNRQQSEPAAASIVANESLRGIERSVLGGADACAANSERTPDAVALSSDAFPGEGERFELELPPNR